MPYRRASGNYMESMHEKRIPDGNTSSGNDSFNTGSLKDMERIPLPNEEAILEHPANSRYISRPGFLNSLLSRIGLEEIIIIGLIFILLQEGIEDDLLLIVLLFILLTGIE